MTVLILAGERDVSADLMVRALGDRGVPVFRADLGWFPQQLTLDAELRDGRWVGRWVGRLVTPHREVALQELRSVWYRSPSTFRFPAAMSGAVRQHAGPTRGTSPASWSPRLAPAWPCCRPWSPTIRRRCGASPRGAGRGVW